MNKAVLFAILASPLFGCEFLSNVLNQDDFRFDSNAKLGNLLDEGNTDFQKVTNETNQITLKRALLSTSRTLLKLYTLRSGNSESTENGGCISVSDLVAENECRLFDLCLEAEKLKRQRSWEGTTEAANKQFENCKEYLMKKALGAKDERD